MALVEYSSEGCAAGRCTGDGSLGSNSIADVDIQLDVFPLRYFLFRSGSMCQNVALQAERNKSWPLSQAFVKEPTSHGAISFKTRTKTFPITRQQHALA